MERKFEGRAALVTGGSSGIGRATALAFSDEGAKVVVAARRKDEGEETVAMIKNRGGEALFVRTDVSKGKEVEALVSRGVEAYGRLDLACNNAGISGPHLVFTADFPEEDWDKVIATNLTGVWLCMKYEIRQMLKQKKGAIVNVSSVAGLVGGWFNSAYYASKHGVIGATKAAAVEYAKEGIRINAVCPGTIRSAMADQTMFKAKNADASLRQNALHPIGRIGTPEEVAAAIIWLCSDAASFMVGHALVVDGGFLSRCGPVVIESTPPQA